LCFKTQNETTLHRTLYIHALPSFVLDTFVGEFALILQIIHVFGNPFEYYIMINDN